MRLVAQLTGLSLLSLSLVWPNVAANPLPLPRALAAALAFPAPTPEPQATCAVPCSDDGSLCCKSTQYCAIWNTVCGEGSRPAAGAAADSASANGNVRVWTSTILTTGTSVQTIISVYSSNWLPPTITPDANPSGNPSTLSGGVAYPTLRPSVSGDNTFLVPMPTSSTGNADFNVGGIIGTNSPPQGLTSAQIGGIVGGILGAFFLIALILLCCCMRRGPNALFGWMNSWSDKETVTHGSSHSSSHGHGHGAGLGTAAAAGGLGYLFGRKAGSRHSASSSHHVVHGGSGAVGRKTGMSALLGDAAAGIAGLFAGRRKSGRTSEKYSTTDISSGYYTSDITGSTSYSSTSTSDSSSSSSSSSSSGHPHHSRH